MKYVEEYLKTVVKIKPLGKLTTKDDELNGMSGAMVYIDGKCADIFISHADYANWLEKQTQKSAECHIDIENEQNLNTCLDYIPDEFLRCWLTDVIYTRDKKADWSVEDTFKVQRICKYLDEAKKYYADITEVRDCIDWLKSLKERYTWKQSNELDEASYQVGIKRVLENPESYGLAKYNWKPSDVQMQVLKEACNKRWEPDGLDPLYTLYEDLKKLKGE